MQINLVPVCEPGVSYGGEMMRDAITRFRKRLLAVIIVCPEEGFEYSGEQARPDNITSADITAAIALFREPGTIGQVTGFIHEDGMYISLSGGTGNSYGKEFMKCLLENDIQPWLYSLERVYKTFQNLSDKSDVFSRRDLDLLLTHERLKYWEKFLLNEIVPHLYTESMGFLGLNSRTGTWQKSWQADEIEEDYTDKDQLEAILSNTDFYLTFLDEIASLRVLNKLTVPDPKAKKTLSRNLYVGVIACLETYLSDAFINTVLSNENYLKSFFISFKDFKEQKLGMNELLDYASKAKEIAKKEMLEVIYHNLPKVSKMYEGTLNLEFPKFSEIQKAVSIRHDLVHRNGKKKDGLEINIDSRSVDDIISKVESFISEIDQKLKEKDNPSESSSAS
ncbi:HEPN domain-containing protein [Microcoleus sp. OTE_8_concoct_300]|uniref:HEPN domain-containing protein n=1 Tax=Microcoleus sp. OTE_8_concoct_300 TaxID=2964710 RepID=UPI00403F0CF5